SCVGLPESAEAPGLRRQTHRLLGLALGVIELASVEETDDAEATQVPRRPRHVAEFERQLRGVPVTLGRGNESPRPEVCQSDQLEKVDLECTRTRGTSDLERAPACLPDRGTVAAASGRLGERE